MWLYEEKQERDLTGTYVQDVGFVDVTNMM